MPSDPAWALDSMESSVTSLPSSNRYVAGPSTIPSPRSTSAQTRYSGRRSGPWSRCRVGSAVPAGGRPRRSGRRRRRQRAFRHSRHCPTRPTTWTPSAKSCTRSGKKWKVSRARGRGGRCRGVPVALPEGRRPKQPDDELVAGELRRLVRERPRLGAQRLARHLVVDLGMEVRHLVTRPVISRWSGVGGCGSSAPAQPARSRARTTIQRIPRVNAAPIDMSSLTCRR